MARPPRLDVVRYLLYRKSYSINEVAPQAGRSSNFLYRKYCVISNLIYVDVHIKHLQIINVEALDRERNMKRLCIFGIVFIQLFPSVIYGQDKFPEWVPTEAVEQAFKYYGRFDYWIYNSDSTSYEFYRENIGLEQWTLRNPYRIIWIDYEKCDIGTDILSCLNFSHIVDSSLTTDAAYGFEAYYKNNSTELIGVSIKNGVWGFFTRVGPLEGEKILGPIYYKYPISSGYVVNKDYFKPYFFVMKDNELIEILEYKRNYKKDVLELLSINPDSLLQREKRRIEDWKKYKRSLEYKNIIN